MTTPKPSPHAQYEQQQAYVLASAVQYGDWQLAVNVIAATVNAGRVEFAGGMLRGLVDAAKQSGPPVSVQVDQRIGTVPPGARVVGLKISDL